MKFLKKPESVQQKNKTGGHCRPPECFIVKTAVLKIITAFLEISKKKMYNKIKEFMKTEWRKFMSLIYCVEDDTGIQELISCALKSGGYEVRGFENSRNLLNSLKTEIPSLILLDVMLPGQDGFQILSDLKRNPALCEIPVIMLTAKSGELDKVKGLELGADDYITKPFGIMELLSRIKAVLRRTGTAVSTSQLITIDKLVIDLQKRNVFYDGKEAVLTYKEFEVLSYLGRHRGTAVSREKLMLNVWGFDYEGESRTVDAHIKTLRQKLEAVGCMDIVTTVRGFGYKII